MSAILFPAAKMIRWPITYGKRSVILFHLIFKSQQLHPNAPQESRINSELHAIKVYVTINKGLLSE